MFTLPKTSNHTFIKVYIFIIATLTTLVFGAFNIKDISLFNFNTVTYGLIIAILGQIVTFELLMYSTKKVSAISMATLTTIELPIAMILSWMLWGPVPNLVKIAALIITLSSIIWLTYEEYTFNQKND